MRPIEQAHRRTGPRRAAALGAEIADWALAGLVRRSTTTAMSSSPLLRQPARQTHAPAAWEWFTPQSAGYNDPALWCRLIETPYDDLRFHVVDDLQRRVRRCRAPPAIRRIRLVAVLLGVHRGGRHKLAALSQISVAIGQWTSGMRRRRCCPCWRGVRSIRALGRKLRAGLAAVVSRRAASPARGGRLSPAFARAALVDGGGG